MVIDNIRKKLKEQCEGKVLVKKNRRYKGLEQDGIQTYDILFSLPTKKEKDTIYKALEDNNIKGRDMLIIGGSYGYKISFEITEI